ncbi:unnamed protein product [Rotaria sp. Silwood1]|nr:unnamed protein product [Rotaria sp. Silwood1]CAF1584942.1 unnamed protein product [Rotaria sp. Silwood1]CAF3608089.1 unnamed protein product [Rotaria sp. Silwood1]CAF3755442.1 unnamed protein product [Rotaria sp. Silwood1]CAF4539425.1 unnamed protein product [Rotaria sp. Silwood1]
MPECCSWLSRLCCCRRRSQHTYIYLYSSTMDGSSSSSSSLSLFNRLACILFGFCLTFILILTAVIIYHLNSNIFMISPKLNTDDSGIISIAKKRQLPDFVNININPCENFYHFVCDKWIRRKIFEKINDDEEEEYKQKWKRIRHRIHNKLMMNISNSQSISSDGNISSLELFVSKLYQLCETQLPSQLLDEFEHHITLLIQQEPYRSYLTLFNQTNSLNLTSLSISFSYNPFFKIIHSSSNNTNQLYSTIIRIDHRPLPSPIDIFSNLTKLNQTAFINLINFNNDYMKFLQEANDTIKLYEQEYNQDSLIMKRILSFSNYHICLSSLKTLNGLKNLIQLLNNFLQNRLRQFNTKLIDKQIRILETITDNHTLVEHLRRIQLEFKIIEQIIPLENQSIDNNSSCILYLLDKLLDKRIQLNEFPSNINLFLHNNNNQEYFISNDWPYLIMLYDRLLNNISIDTLVNFIYFDYYRHLIYPYYQPHIHHLINFKINQKKKSYTYIYNMNYSTLSCHINSCFDILNCYHPSLINQLIDDKNQIHLDSIRTSFKNIINRFRILIEQSDHLFIEEKKLLINELNQIKISFEYYSTKLNFFFNFNISSYLEYIKLFSLIPYDQQEYSYGIEPIYNQLNHTIFLPYSFIYLSNNSIEYSLMKFLLNILSKTIPSNPFYIECLIKYFDDLNTTIINIDDEHIIYLLFRSKFVFEQNIILDEYLWPFMSANSLMKHFLIDYTAKNYCHSFNAYHLFLNNTYLIDDIYLVFHCQQASSIKQSKCSVH